MNVTRRNILKLFNDVPSYRDEYRSRTFNSGPTTSYQSLDGTIDETINSDKLDESEKQTAMDRRTFYQIGMSSLPFVNKIVSHPLISGSIAGAVGGVSAFIYQSNIQNREKLKVNTHIVSSIIKSGYHPDRLSAILSIPNLSDGEKLIIDYTRAFEENNIAVLAESVKDDLLYEANSENKYVSNYIALRQAINCMLCGLFDQAALHINKFNSDHRSNDLLNLDFFVRKIVYTLHSSETDSFISRFGLSEISPRIMSDKFLNFDITATGKDSEVDDIFKNFGVNGFFIRYAQKLHDFNNKNSNYGEVINEIENFLYWSKANSNNHFNNTIDVWYQIPRLTMHAALAGNYDEAIRLYNLAEGIFSDKFSNEGDKIRQILNSRFQTNYILHIFSKIILSDIKLITPESEREIASLRMNFSKISNPTISRAVALILEEKNLRLSDQIIAISRSAKITSFKPVLDFVRLSNLRESIKI